MPPVCLPRGSRKDTHCRCCQTNEAPGGRRGSPFPFDRGPTRWRRSEIPDRSRIPGLLLALLFCGSPLLAADKVDVVNLRNGDRITCEIKALSRSLLSISTDPLGKASVHWGEVAGLTSPRRFDVLVTSGQHFYGTLLPSAPGQMLVGLDGGGTATLALTDLIDLSPLGANWWSRVDGALDAGFSFTQASHETHLTLNGSSTYTGPRYQVNATIASQVTTGEDTTQVSRNSIGLGWRRSLSNHWYTIGWGSLQQNEELSLDLRAVGGGGLGKELVHTGSRLWSTYAGLVYTVERFSGEPQDESVEAAAGAQFDFFTPSKEDFQFTNSLVSYFNVQRPRVRLEAQNAWRHEFLSDFYWSVNAFDSFDSEPPAGRKTNDFGVSFTLGWKF
jgi:hypothetical protein